MATPSVEKTETQKEKPLLLCSLLTKAEDVAENQNLTSWLNLPTKPTHSSN